ncbi:MAG: response regulator transcription factor [Oscillospiraceae bacterium]|nr:response regulator transcription factor [Oscillospiraceae bacterium]
MRFAVVDDEHIVLEKLPQLIRSQMQNINPEIECFQRASELMTAYESFKFDALFLDIDMPDLSGFDLAEQLRLKDDNIPIVYVTGRDDLITTAFRYKPVGFVRKQRIESELPFAIATILSELGRKKASITVTEVRSAGGKTHTVLINHIRFIETTLHNADIHLVDESQLTVRGVLSDYLNQLGFESFVQINSGTIVNLAHTTLMKDQIVFENGTVLYVSRRRLSEVQKAYLKYVKKVLI